MTIKFYTPKDEYIPTELRLKITDIPNHPDLSAIYKRSENEFAYEITIFKGLNTQNNTNSICREIVEKFANLLVSQSYDHGAQWRVTDIIEMFSPMNLDDFSVTYKIRFYVRDAG